MKTCGVILCCALGGLALVASTVAAKANAGRHPYQSIAARNVFSLRPLDSTPVTPQPLTLPIALQGFTSGFGRKQALFKVGQTSFLLNERERRDEIEVMEINERTATVKFRNRGAVQVLGLGVAGR